jgi:glycosyltransferase involved in cell wall biosynthesis
MHYAVPTLLHREGYLYRLFTDAYAGQGSRLHTLLSVLPASWRRGPVKRFAERSADIPADKVVAYNWLGIQYALARSTTSDKMNVYRQYGPAFLRRIVSDLSDLDAASAVYAYSRTGCELFEFASEQGIYCILEQMSAPIKTLSALLNNQASMWPGWQLDGQPLFDDLDYWLARERREWELADVIIAPSAYVRSALIDEGVNPERIRLLPYAVSPERFQARLRQYNGTRPLRIAFVGTLNLRKGIPYLLEALKRLGPEQVQARLIGSVEINRDRLAEYHEVAEVLGRVPRSEVVKHYDWADLFVLPSVCEGSATVTYEARAAGLPVVATPNSGAWIDEGQDGNTVPACDALALFETISRFRSRPELVGTMSQNALLNAPHYSWEAYARRLRELVLETAASSAEC